MQLHHQNLMGTHIICHLCHFICQHGQENGRYFWQDLFLLEWQLICHINWSLELYDVQRIKEVSDSFYSAERDDTFSEASILIPIFLLFKGHKTEEKHI